MPNDSSMYLGKREINIASACLILTTLFKLKYCFVFSLCDFERMISLIEPKDS